ncbi:hypothetical protein CDCA_CDCA13G3642 [Cyanidium caldarium]|uniref:GOLD domain-containing protein n=1 Tax=Cyanidium caldarium TaxID=2771 RepID=A0AAV9IZ51_CYACA|nr:hypothetical protein CDCA_CDCA13G3642 [Cyanidium caldarium]
MRHRRPPAFPALLILLLTITVTMFSRAAAWVVKLDPEVDPHSVCFLADVGAGRELQGFFEVIPDEGDESVLPVDFAISGPIVDTKDEARSQGAQLVHKRESSAPFVFQAPASGVYELCFGYAEEKRARQISFSYEFGKVEEELSELLEDVVKHDKHLEPLRLRAVSIMHELRNAQMAQLRMKERIRQNLRMLRARQQRVAWATLLELMVVVAVSVLDVVFVKRKFDTRRPF